MPTRARYTGKTDKDNVPQEFLSGIPARNLTTEDWDQLDKGQRDAVRRSGLYDTKSNAEMEARPSRPSAPDSEPAAGGEGG